MKSWAFEMLTNKRPMVIETKTCIVDITVSLGMGMEMGMVKKYVELVKLGYCKRRCLKNKEEMIMTTKRYEAPA